MIASSRRNTSKPFSGRLLELPSLRCSHFLLMLMGEPGTPPPKYVSDRGNFPKETKPRDSLGMGIVDRMECGSLVALQA